MWWWRGHLSNSFARVTTYLIWNCFADCSIQRPWHSTAKFYDILDWKCFYWARWRPGSSAKYFPTCSDKLDLESSDLFFEVHRDIIDWSHLGHVVHNVPRHTWCGISSLIALSSYIFLNQRSILIVVLLLHLYGLSLDCKMLCVCQFLQALPPSSTRALPPTGDILMVSMRYFILVGVSCCFFSKRFFQRSLNALHSGTSWRLILVHFARRHSSMCIYP